MSILSSTKTGTSSFLVPRNRRELVEMISNEIKEKGLNCDLNHINTYKISDMSYLFSGSKFNGDISKWNVSNVESMNCMFWDSNFKGDISKWNVRNVENMSYMFCGSKFNRDISNWKIKPDCRTSDIFYKCPIKDEYKPIILLKQEKARRKFASYIITRI